ncbi:unnamed protein product [Lathyrus sativus]|nr:unnamed protein product [Lathyrus sativus]
MYPFVRLLSSGTTIIPRAAAPVTDVQVFSVINLCDCHYLYVKHGSTSFIQQPQNSRGSMFGTSFESERASRIRAEQLAAATSTRLEEATKVIQASNDIAQKATEQYQASNEFVKKMESELNALKAFIMQKLDPTNGQSARVVIRSSNPHYDDDLDDQSLSED